MPEYDLGTAHGRIKIDVDDRGAKSGEKTLDAFNKTVKKLDRQFAAFQASATKLERELKKVSGDFARGDREARKYGQGVDSADRSQGKFSRSATQISTTLRTAIDRFRSGAAQANKFGEAMHFAGSHVQSGRKDVEVLNLRLRELISRLHAAGNAVGSFGPTVANMVTAFNRLGDSNGIGGFIKSFRGLPFAGAALGGLTNQLLGVNKAMKDIPRWQKSIVSLVGAFSGLALTSKVSSAIFNGIFRKADFRPIQKYKQHIAAAIRMTIGAYVPLSKTGAQVERLTNAFKNFGVGAAQTIAGIAVMRSGVKGLADRFAFLAKMPGLVKLGIVGLIGSLGALMQAGGKALTFLSNLLNGLLNAVTQLAGGLLALPGAIGTIVVAGGVLATVFSGLKTAFEDVFKNMDDPEKFAEAMAAVPPKLRPLAGVLVDTVKTLKGLREEMTGVFSTGLDKDVKTLSDQFMGPLRQGALAVTNSFVDTRAKLMSLLTSQKNVQDFGLAFGYTAGTVRNLNLAIEPLGNAIRDIVVVGMEFIRNFTGGAQGVTKTFEEWARVNRENGNLMKWMTDAVSGAKDLLRGLWDLTKALWSLLTLFADDSGENALSRFADSMEKFNNAVNKSKADGVLKKIGDAVRNVGTEKISELVDIFRSVVDAAKDVWPVIQQVSSAFSDIFVPAVKLGLQIIELFFAALDQLGPLKTMAGYLLGIVAAFGLLKTVIGPIRNLIQIFGGLGTAVTGAQKLMSGFVDLLYYFGGAGQKAHGALTRVGGAISGLLGPLAAAAAAVAIFYSSVNDQNNDIKNFKQGLEDAKKSAQDFKYGLRDAFSADMGVSGKTVFGTVNDRLRSEIDTLKAQASEVPGIWDNIVAAFNPSERSRDDSFWGQRNPFAQGVGFNEMQKAAQDAAHAQKAFDKLGLSTENLAAAATGSDDIFDNLVASFKGVPEGGAEAISVLQKVRNEYQQTQADFAKAGTGGVQLANGITAIADSAGDANTKLNGLKLALQGLGLLQTSQIDAGFAYAESIRKIGEEATNAAAGTERFDDILTEGGGFNFASVGAQNLYEVLRPLADNFLNLAANGGSVAQSYADLRPQIDGIANAFKLTVPQVDALLSSIGVVPDVVSILVNVEGGDKVGQQLAAIAAKLTAVGTNTPITIPIVPGTDLVKLKQAVEAALGPVVDGVNEDVINIKPGVDPAALEAFKKTLLQNGIPVPGMPPPPAMPLPVGAPPKEGPPPAFVPPVTEDIDPPEIAPPPADQAALDKANQTIAELKTKVDELNAEPAKIQIDTGTLTEVKAKVEELQKMFADGKLEFTIIAKGYDETNFVLGTVKKAIAEFLAEVDKIQPALVRAFGTQPLDAFSARLTGLVGEMRSAGSMLVSELAAGMLESKHLVDEAGNTIATAVNEYLKGRSPTKKGPLSGSGWTKVSGAKLVEAFAEGMVGAQGSVAGASSRVAGSAGGALQGPYDIGKFLGQLQQLSNFGQHIAEVFEKISTTILSAVKFISDPLGEGKFFGKSAGFVRDKTISDDDLRKKREDDLQAKIQSGAKDGTRAGLKDLPGAAGLSEGASPEEIQAAIIGEAGKRGWGRNATIAALATAMQESGSGAASSNIFQQDASYADRGTLAGNIEGFFDRFSGGINEADPWKDIFKVQQGTPFEKGRQGYLDEITAHSKDAANVFDTVAGQLSDSAKGIDSSGVNVTGRNGLTKVSENLLEQVIDAFPEVENIGGVRKDAIADHPSGRALDIMIGDNMELGDRINQWLRGNAAALGVDSTIWRNTWRDIGTDATSKVTGHMDHIHAKTVQEALGSFNNDLIENNPFDPTNTTHGLGSNTGPNLQGLTESELKLFNETQGLSLQTQDQMLAELRRGNAALDASLTAGQADAATTDQQIAALVELQKVIDTQDTGTAAGRSRSQALEGVKSDIMGKGGITEEQNPVDQATQLLSGISNIAGSVFDVINSSLESFGAAKQIGDTLVRGVENTEDIYNMIDSVQKFIELAASVAGAVSSITSAVGSIASIGAGADMGASGAISAVGQIAGIVQSALETVNAVIDLGQEVYRIAGSYFGEFLGFLTGGGKGSLEGDVRFLLDQNEGVLKAYSQDNPMDKREHRYRNAREGNNAPQIGEVNVFGGPGQDPRETTRNMMFAVKSASMGAGSMN